MRACLYVLTTILAALQLANATSTPAATAGKQIANRQVAADPGDMAHAANNIENTGISYAKSFSAKGEKKRSAGSNRYSRRNRGDKKAKRDPQNSTFDNIGLMHATTGDAYNAPFFGVSPPAPGVPGAPAPGGAAPAPAPAPAAPAPAKRQFRNADFAASEPGKAGSSNSELTKPSTEAAPAPAPATSQASAAAPMSKRSEGSLRYGAPFKLCNCLKPADASRRQRIIRPDVNLSLLGVE